MSDKLTITKGSFIYVMEEVGKFSWTEDGAGGITITAAPPRAAGQQNPALAALSESLKSVSKASAAKAAEDAAAPVQKVAATKGD